MSRHHEDAPDPSRPRPTPPTSAQLGFLGRLGRGVSRHHRWVALVWLAILMVGAYFGAADKGSISDNVRIPDTGSQSAYDLLQERFSSQNAATATVVFSVPQGQQLTSPDNAAPVAAAAAALGKVDGVASVTDPLTQNCRRSSPRSPAGFDPAEAQAVEAIGKNLPPSVSSDGRIAYSTIIFTPPWPICSRSTRSNAEEAGQRLLQPLLRVGDGPLRGSRRATSRSRSEGRSPTPRTPRSRGGPTMPTRSASAVGALLLLVAFGSLFGMAIPIATALFGAVTASGFVYLLASFTTVSSAAPPVTLMISIGVGLDYSLLIVTRYRSSSPRATTPTTRSGWPWRRPARPRCSPGSRSASPCSASGSCPSRWCRRSALPPPSASR